MEPVPRYTYQDLKEWPGEERWELVCGQPYLMTSPTSGHQRIVGKIYAQLSKQLIDSECEALMAPMDVKLTEQDVVQPDLLVYCDPQQDRGSYIEGAPVLAVEVLSPSTYRHDRIRKLQLYARAGVKEYWIVNPEPPIFEVLSLNEGAYRVCGAYSECDELRSPAFPGITLSLSEIFGPPQDWPGEVRESLPPDSGRTASPATT